MHAIKPDVEAQEVWLIYQANCIRDNIAQHIQTN
jgi:hypothetical protein